jgi:hypothetical protein
MDHSNTFEFQKSSLAQYPRMVKPHTTTKKSQKHLNQKGIAHKPTPLQLEISKIQPLTTRHSATSFGFMAS